MRNIESRPIPLRSRGLTGDLKRLIKPTDSFLIENKGLKRAVLFSTASRLGIRVITQAEDEGLRVWRNFDVEGQPLESIVDEEPMSRQDVIAGLRASITLTEQGHKPFAVPAEQYDFEDWRFTKLDKPQFADDGRVYRKQALYPLCKRTRTVEVDQDNLEAIVRVKG